ncbi:uncharacterized protein LOC18046337 [Citrus clementina]|uniref:uncharacterized protein LOC18046337 n=1 Tax=Citrus clementina TaxID=85681 RepID=UPI000763AB50|nr:uncharacterized protein LOC18046337 [Citrus x clementina]
MTDDLGYTALHYAAVGGGLKACRALVRKNPDLTQTTSNDGWTPLLAAACCTPKDEETVWYLALHTTDAPRGCPFTGPLADILLYLIERGNPGLATVRDDCGCNLLDALASKPSDFESGNNPVELNHISPLSAKVGVFSTSPKFWKIFTDAVGWTAPPIKQIQDEKLKHKYAMVLIKCVARELSSLSDPQIYEFFPQVGHHNRCSSLWRC